MDQKTRYAMKSRTQQKMIRHTSYGLSINVRNEDGKYKAEYRQGYWNSITRTNEADGIAEFETEFGVYLKNNVVMLHYRKQSNKTKLLMDSTILLQLIQQTTVWLKAFHNQQKLKLYKHEEYPSFYCK